MGPLYHPINDLNSSQCFENLVEMVENPKRKLLCMMNVLVGFVVGGSNIMEWVHLLGFPGGGEDNVFDIYGCCNVAYAKRTLTSNILVM